MGRLLDKDEFLVAQTGQDIPDFSAAWPPRSLRVLDDLQLVTARSTAILSAIGGRVVRATQLRILRRLLD